MPPRCLWWACRRRGMRCCWWGDSAVKHSNQVNPAHQFSVRRCKAVESRGCYEQGSDLGGAVHRRTSGLCDGAASACPHGGPSTACGSCSATSGHRRADGRGLCGAHLPSASHWIFLGVPSTVRMGLEASSTRMASWMAMKAMSVLQTGIRAKRRGGLFF